MHKFILPHYFSHSIRRQVAELYASTAIADLALAMVMLFEPIYFMVILGWTVTEVLLFFSGVYFLYILFIPLGAKIVALKGYEHAILFSIPFQIGYWLLLFFAAETPMLAYLAIPAFAIQKSLFWPAFHSDLARFSVAGQRTREFSGVFALSHLVYVLGPLIGGFVSAYFGLKAVLIVASAVYFTMFIPMFTTPEVFKPKPYKFKVTLSYYRKFPREVLAYLGFGEELIILVIWPIFIYKIVADFMNFGSVIAVSTLLATIIMLYAGKIADLGKKLSVLRTGATGSILVWLFRFFITNTPAVILTDFMSRVSRDLFYVAIIANMYDRGNQEHILPYAVFFEQVLSIGKLMAALLGAALFGLTQSFAALFILGLGFTALYLLLPIARPAHRPQM